MPPQRGQAKRGALRFHETILLAALVVALAANVINTVMSRHVQLSQPPATDPIPACDPSPAAAAPAVVLEAQPPVWTNPNFSGAGRNSDSSQSAVEPAGDEAETLAAEEEKEGEGEEEEEVAQFGSDALVAILEKSAESVPAPPTALDTETTSEESQAPAEPINAAATKAVYKGPIDTAMCFQTPSSRPKHYIEGAYNLRSFSITFWMRAPADRSPPCKVPFNNHWFDGCMLVIGAPGNNPSAFWATGARTYRKKRSRNDFGVSMGKDGQLMFGMGHRSLKIATIPWKGRITLGIPKFPIYKTAVYAGEDHTLHTTTKVNDGKWHHVAVERNASHRELAIYIDGVPHTCTNGLGHCVGNLTNHNRLTDTYFRAALGWGFDGCMRDVELHAAASLAALEHYEDKDIKANDDTEGTLGPSGVAAIMKATERQVGPYPVFYYYIANNDSEWLHTNFRESIISSGNEESLQLRPISAGNAIFHGARWGFKLNMVIQALKSQEPGAIILVSDIDIVYFRPVAPIIW
jgi:hypothetical protein